MPLYLFAGPNLWTQQENNVVRDLSLMIPFVLKTVTIPLLPNTWNPVWIIAVHCFMLTKMEDDFILVLRRLSNYYVQSKQFTMIQCCKYIKYLGPKVPARYI